MPFFKIAHTNAERKQIRQFWEEMRKKAEEIHDEYTSVKENTFHEEFYNRLFNKVEIRPNFFEPIHYKK